MIQRFFSFVLSSLFHAVFAILLIIFHGLQVVTHRCISLKAQQKVVHVLNFMILKALHILGTSQKFICEIDLPKNVPLLIVSNHQSMFDISMISWFLREKNPLFVSKKELGKGIPSISYNLRHGGSILIDRNNPRQAIREISNFGQKLEKEALTGVIFPEGTRSRDGKLKKFNTTGLKVLISKMPSGYIIPVTINNSWKIAPNGNFPLGIGSRLELKVHEPVKIAHHKIDYLLEHTKNTIEKSIY